MLSVSENVDQYSFPLYRSGEYELVQLWKTSWHFLMNLNSLYNFHFFPLSKCIYILEKFLHMFIEDRNICSSTVYKCKKIGTTLIPTNQDNEYINCGIYIQWNIIEQ